MIPVKGAVTVYVCVTCREPGGPEEARPGARLHERLAALIAERGLAERLCVAPVECLSVCKRPATVALTGADRWTYVFGDIGADADLDAVLAGLLAFEGAANGVVPWRERPDFMKRGVVARIPPFPGASAAPSARAAQPMESPAE